MTPGSSFCEYTHVRGLTAPWPGLLGIWKVSLNNPRQTSYVGPEDINKSDRLPKWDLKCEDKCSNLEFLKLYVTFKNLRIHWEVYLTPLKHKAWNKCNFCLFLCKILWSIEHVGLILRSVPFDINHEITWHER